MATILTGPFATDLVFIPREPIMTTDHKSFPLMFKRRQFPARPAFAITINKSQGALKCVTTDAAATTFYAFAYDRSYDSVYPVNRKVYEAILIKSNTNPASPDRLTWSVVSRIDSRSLAGDFDDVNDAAEYSCTTNAQGVFTLLGRYSGSLSSGTPFGVRYDPTATMDSKFNFKGPGGWMNITIHSNYNWPSSYKEQTLGYVNSGGNSVLVHAIRTPSSFNIATLNEETKTLTGVASWPQNLTNYATTKAFTIGSDNLYTFATALGGISSVDSVYLYSYPLSTITAAPPVRKSFNTTQTANCHSSPTPYLYTLGGSLVFICDQSTDRDFPSTLYTIADPNIADSVGVPESFTLDITYMDFFVPIGPGAGQSSFALTQTSTTSFLYETSYKLYAFGKDAAGSRFLQSVPNVDVIDPVGINPNPSSPPPVSGGGGGRGGGSSSSSSGAIAGAVAGVVALVALVIFLVMLRRCNNNRATIIEAESDKDKTKYTVVTNNYVHSPPPGQNGGPDYYNPPGQHLAAPFPEGEPASDTILPMAPITPLTPQQHQTLQEQMQALQFSTHPRPNFITTSSGGELETTNVPLADSPGPYSEAAGTPAAPWPQMPYVTPTHPNDSASMPSLSLACSPTTASAFSTAATNTFNDPQSILSDDAAAVTPDLAASKPLPSLPPVSCNIRPISDARRPHVFSAATNSPQYVDDGPYMLVHK
ncbi:hypothetical protein BG015_004046 [Linnemannia schmuckeri]|uniref:Uncharacterized protein n=1 Tax=Linnemannia schmuckeri TaxID=64567 RepID=A0A9P5V1M7_9FUNG|nr:hypothetical protein BG015_004046 [Linnemannia schmuckeri]